MRVYLRFQFCGKNRSKARATLSLRHFPDPRENLNLVAEG